MPEARDAFEGFGFGCSVEEHVKYGRCLDGGCSGRARWESTSSRKAGGGPVKRVAELGGRRTVLTLFNSLLFYSPP